MKTRVVKIDGQDYNEVDLGRGRVIRTLRGDIPETPKAEVVDLVELRNKINAIYDKLFEGA